MESDMESTMQPTTIEYSEVVSNQTDTTSAINPSEPDGNLHAEVEVHTGDTFVNVTNSDNSVAMNQIAVNGTDLIGNYTDYGDYGNYTDYYNYTDYMYNDTYYYDNITYEYYDDQYYESYDTVYYDEYNVDDNQEVDKTHEEDEEQVPTRLTYEQMLSSPPPRGTFNLQMALIDSRNHGYGKDCKNSGSSRPKVKNNFIPDAL